MTIATQTDIPVNFGSGGSGLTPNGSSGSPSLRTLLQEHKVALGALDTASVQKRSITVGHANLTVAGTTEVENIGAALPANARILGISLHTVTPFSGGGTGAQAVDIGTSGDPDALIDGADLFAAAVDGQAASLPSGIAPNKLFVAAGAQLIATFVTDTTQAAFTAGAVTIDVFFVVLA